VSPSVVFVVAPLGGIPRRAFLVDSRGVSAMSGGLYGWDVVPKTIGTISAMVPYHRAPKSGKRFHDSK